MGGTMKKKIVLAGVAMLMMAGCSSVEGGQAVPVASASPAAAAVECLPVPLGTANQILQGLAYGGPGVAVKVPNAHQKYLVAIPFYPPGSGMTTTGAWITDYLNPNYSGGHVSRANEAARTYTSWGALNPDGDFTLTSAQESQVADMLSECL